MMIISEVIDRLEEIQRMCGDIEVVGADEICGDEYVSIARSVTVETDKGGVKCALIEFWSPKFATRKFRLLN